MTEDILSVASAKQKREQLREIEEALSAELRKARQTHDTRDMGEDMDTREWGRTRRTVGVVWANMSQFGRIWCISHSLHSLISGGTRCGSSGGKGGQDGQLGSVAGAVSDPPCLWHLVQFTHRTKTNEDERSDQARFQCVLMNLRSHQNLSCTICMINVATAQSRILSVFYWGRDGIGCAEVEPAAQETKAKRERWQRWERRLSDDAMAWTIGAWWHLVSLRWNVSGSCNEAGVASAHPRSQTQKETSVQKSFEICWIHYECMFFLILIWFWDY